MQISYKIAQEINKVRTNPKDYCHQLSNFKMNFDHLILNLPDFNVGIKTSEGKKAYDDAIDFLEKQNEIHPLNPIQSLFKISEDYLTEIQKIDYSEINNIDIESIIKKYGDFCGNFCRIVKFGYSDPEVIVNNLLACDGDSNRNERKIVMNENFYDFGVAFGKHNFFGYCTVIVFCSEFKSKESNNDENVDIGYEEQ